jgi:hypothetical protein
VCFIGGEFGASSLLFGSLSSEVALSVDEETDQGKHDKGGGHGGVRADEPNDEQDAEHLPHPAPSASLSRQFALGQRTSCAMPSALVAPAPAVVSMVPGVL